MLTSEEANGVRRLLRDLPSSYPGAEAWLERRLTDVTEGRAWAAVAREGDSVVGVALAVSKPEARFKLCTLYVAPAHRGRGLGAGLLDAALAAADGRETYITASARALHDLGPLLERAGFALTAVARDRYGRGRHEFVLVRRD